MQRYRYQADAYPHQEFYFELRQLDSKFKWAIRFSQRDGTPIDVPPGVSMYEEDGAPALQQGCLLLYYSIASFKLWYKERCIMTLEPMYTSRVTVENSPNLTVVDAV